MEEKSIQPKQEEQEEQKKAYTPPALTVYGKLTDLTAAGTGKNPEPTPGGGSIHQQRT